MGRWNDRRKERRDRRRGKDDSSGGTPIQEFSFIRKEPRKLLKPKKVANMKVSRI